jgi:radical SAM/Cys-rich protein
MLQTANLLTASDFPPISRQQVTTLQVNLGYLCNLSCVHCHVNAGPSRTEMMTAQTVDQLLLLLDKLRPEVLDLTGGAPELNPQFRRIVIAARERGVKVVDRCNLTVLFEPGQEDMPEFLAAQGVIISASLPCYLEENVQLQRGKGVFSDSIRAIRRLNALGYGRDPALELNLVYNPVGALLPPPQEALQAEYKRELGQRYNIVFDQLYTITNMPINRFGAVLHAHDQFHSYMQLLRDNFSAENLSTVMCRSLVSIDWRGYVYDCDFNQLLELPVISSDRPVHISNLLEDVDIGQAAIATDAHCYGCTAGQGSSCGGALDGG